MKKQLLTISLAAGILPTSAFSASVVTVDYSMWQEYSIAPLFDGTSGSWPIYRANVRAAASGAGFGNAGDPATPGYFTTVNSTIVLNQMVVTGPTGPGRVFNSWLGQANPGTVFGSAFAGEYGNRIHSPMLFKMNSLTPTTISEIVSREYSEAETGSDVVPAFTTTWSTWNNSRVGISSYGADNALGGTGPDADTYLTSGSMSATPVLAAIVVGIGVGFDMRVDINGDPWSGAIPDEDIMGEYYNQWNSAVYDYRVEYDVKYNGGSTTAGVGGDVIYTVPEPHGAVFSVASAFCLLLVRRRKAA